MAPFTLLALSVLLFVAGFVMWGSSMPVLGILAMLVSTGTLVGAIFATVVE